MDGQTQTGGERDRQRLRCGGLGLWRPPEAERDWLRARAVPPLHLFIGGCPASRFRPQAGLCLATIALAAETHGTASIPSSSPLAAPICPGTIVQYCDTDVRLV
ncbi:hypothetical protein SORBI_3002G041150 [Sorghum bicolor]|uniref:Uncharacterized protein n=1 Tax=Sorghum bicolor TaxID=4558 RepID=A0A1W0W274_SORBI|nr:hypothetical protein SORBI_3002G041150 [Sorghum bicolor]